MRKLLLSAPMALIALASTADAQQAAPQRQPARAPADLPSEMIDVSTGKPMDPRLAATAQPAPAQAPMPVAPQVVPVPQPGALLPPSYTVPAPAAAPAPGGQQFVQVLVNGQVQWMPLAPQAPAQAAQPVAPGYPGMPPGGVAPPPSPAQANSPADLAFQQALQSLIPMNPGQITQFKQTLDQTQRTIAAPVNGAPKPITRSISLSLKPGEAPAKLRLYPGNATTLTLSDRTGASWPVQSVTVGNPQAYVAQEAGEKGKTNMVVISPLSQYQQATNLVITLVGHPVPIIFNLETGTNEVDYRLDVALQERGPNAAYDIIGATTLAPTNDPNVQGFVDGVAPRGARKLTTSNRDVEAWKFNDMVYVRTPLELLSPAYVGRAKSVSRVNVYTMVESPVLVFSQDGRLVSVTIER